MRTMTGGWLVAGMGLPGCGKSAVFCALSKLMNVEVFLEPEEAQWGQAVYTREQGGHFTALSWFRASRVPLLFEAAAARDAGRHALLDSYYDKLLSLYIDKPGMEWVISRRDPYFKLASEMADLDLEQLPDADAVVFFELDEPTWHNFLAIRNRSLDKHPGMLNSFATQADMKEAATNYCAMRGVKLLLFKQEVSSIESAAQRLLELLRTNGFSS